MPLSQPLSHTAPYLWPTKVGWRTHIALDILVQEPVIKPSEQRRRETVAGEQGVRAGFLCRCGRLAVSLEQLAQTEGEPTLAINDNVGTSAVGTQQDGLVVQVCFGEAREVVDGFKELVQGVSPASQSVHMSDFCQDVPCW